MSMRNNMPRGAVKKQPQSRPFKVRITLVRSVSKDLPKSHDTMSRLFSIVVGSFLFS